MAGSPMQESKPALRPPTLDEVRTLADSLHLTISASDLAQYRDLLEEKEQEWQPRSSLWMIEDFGDDRA